MNWTEKGTIRIRSIHLPQRHRILVNSTLRMREEVGQGNKKINILNQGIQLDRGSYNFPLVS